MTPEEIKKQYDAIPEELKVTLQKKMDWLQEIYPKILFIKVKKDLASMAMLGLISKDYCREFKCSPAEFISDVNTFEQAFMEASINKHGIGFNEEVHQVPTHLKEKNKRNFSKNESSTCSIGDMLKAKGQQIKI